MKELCFCVSHSNDAFEFPKQELLTHKKKARMRLQTMSSCDCQCLVTVMLLCVARGVVVTSCGTDFIITYNIEMLSVIVAFIFLAPDGTKRYKSVLSIT